jgi:long-chain acyl-CoA synthetase
MRADLATLITDYRRFGKETAVVVYRGNREHVCSYGALADLAERFAAELMRREIRSGERVVIWGQNGPEWIAAFFGCVLRGVLAVPLDAAGGADFAQRVIAETGPRLLTGDASMLGRLTDGTERLAFEEFAEGLPRPPFPQALREPSLGTRTPLQAQRRSPKALCTRTATCWPVLSPLSARCRSISATSASFIRCGFCTRSR